MFQDPGLGISFFVIRVWACFGLRSKGVDKTSDMDVSGGICDVIVSITPRYVLHNNDV